MNIDEIKAIIKQEEIFSIDVRYINSKGHWEGIVYPSYNFDYELFKGITINKATKTFPLTLERHFIDPFLAHRTLVFLTDLEGSVNSLIYKEISDKKQNQTYEFSFYIDYKDTLKNEDEAVEYFMPPYDSARDIRTEIVLALSQINTEVAFHYSNKDNKHIIAIKSENSLFHHLDDIQKLKYCCLMVAKAYNISIVLNKGIFVEQANPYEFLGMLTK